MKPSATSSWNSALLRRAALDALRKLDPRALWANPVIFATAVGAVAVTFAALGDLLHGRLTGFTLQLTLWLWFTVLFANFAEAIAEGRGKAQADALRRARADDADYDTVAKNMPIVGCAVLNELLLERHIF